ncbi:MAG: hypothetical protein JXQ87_01660 [Bacteroidia bacterium]
MKQLFLLTIVAVFMAPNKSSAQLGKQFFFELSPLYFLSQGGGGAIGTEKGHWQNGLAFNTFNPNEFYSNGKIHVTGSISAIRAMSFEPFTRFYFSKERKWLYLGLNLVPELYTLKDEKTGETSLSLSAYAKPKVGLRWFPFKRIFYLDAGYAMSIKILDSDVTQLTNPEFTFSDFIGMPEFSVGVRIK